MISRRGFLGLVSAAVVAPLLPAPAVFIPIRRASGAVDLLALQRQYNTGVSAELEAIIRQAAENLAQDIDRRAFDYAMHQKFAAGDTIRVRLPKRFEVAVR